MKVIIDNICRQCDRAGCKVNRIKVRCTSCGEHMEMFMSSGHPVSEARLVRCPMCDGGSVGLTLIEEE